MKNLERMMLEMLFDKKLRATPGRNYREKSAKDMTVKQFIKVLRNLPEFKKDFESALKVLDKQEHKKDFLTTGHRFMLWTLAALTVPPMYIVLVHWLFTTVVTR